MSLHVHEFLVEIRLKDWVPGEKRIIGYEEVIAFGEYEARHTAFDQFIKRTEYEPIARRKWKESGLSRLDICAPDAVKLDYTN